MWLINAVRFRGEKEAPQQSELKDLADGFVQ
jgi:hypothetical protein